MLVFCSICLCPVNYQTHVRSYNDAICLPEGICYLLLGEFEKSKQKLSEALEISEEFETKNKDEIMYYYKQLEDQGI